MDSNLKNLLESKKSLIKDTKIPSIKKQKTEPVKGKVEEPIESCPYKRMAKSAVKDLPTKADLIEKFQSFITAEEARL